MKAIRSFETVASTKSQGVRAQKFTADNPKFGLLKKAATGTIWLRAQQWKYLSTWIPTIAGM
jgi:hypothetical protein